MKVAFLQHHESLRPGKLSDYLVRRHQARTTVLKAHEVREDHPVLAAADLIVSLGSPVSVYRTDVDWVAHERRILSSSIARGTPVLGICFGAQMIASVIGGSMTAIGRSYVGWLENDAVAAAVWRGPWFRFHKDQCQLPASAEMLARSQGIIQAFQYRSAIGLQFHPEMDAAIVEELVPSMRRDFGMSAAETDTVLADTRSKVDAISTAREALFDEVLRRLFSHVNGDQPIA